MSHETQHTRCNVSVRLNAFEREKLKAAAARYREGDLSAFSWSNAPAKPATLARAVVVDWAEYVGKLPPEAEPAKPSQVVRRLEERIAHLEAELAAARGEEVPERTSRPRRRGAA